MSPAKRKVKRAQLLERQGWRCFYCYTEIQEGGPNQATLDHIIPQSFGGTDEDENLCVACQKCNSQKANLMPWSFYNSKRVKERRFLNTKESRVLTWRDFVSPERYEQLTGRPAPASPVGKINYGRWAALVGLAALFAISCGYVADVAAVADSLSQALALCLPMALIGVFGMRNVWKLWKAV